jgi:lysyl-tRNA synthetase class 2
VDLTVNDHVKETLLREQMFNAMRSFFDRGYLEVETPVLADSRWCCRTFITHHNSLDMPLYMRIANELYLKDCWWF